jgi:hypothetical protein
VIQQGVTTLNQQLSATILSARRERIFKWLSAVNPFSSHAAARKKCQSLTGLWFVKGVQFEQWLDSPNSVFWICGIREYDWCVQLFTTNWGNQSWKWKDNSMVGVVYLNDFQLLIIAVRQ